MQARSKISKLLSSFRQTQFQEIWLILVVGGSRVYILSGSCSTNFQEIIENSLRNFVLHR